MKRKHLSQLLVVLVMVLSLVLIGSASTTLTDGQLVRGDANGDGAINMKDVLLLRKYLAGMDVEIADHICSGGATEPTESTQATEPTEPTQATEASTPSSGATTASTTASTTPSSSATTPSTSETTPSTSETTPSSSATTASTSATTPSTSATPPSTSATTPSTSATTASTSATTASTTATQPSYTMPCVTSSSATSSSATQTSATQSANSIKVSLNITEYQTKYASDVQVRDEYFFVEKGQPMTFVLTYDNVYHATEKVTNGEAAGWFDLKANGTGITPKEIKDEGNKKIIATYDLGTASTDITVTGDVKRFIDSTKMEDFRSVIITINGQAGEGSSVRTTPMVTDDAYPAFPDMVTLAFNDPATCSQYGILWHTYKDVTAPQIQYLEGEVTDTALFAANAQNITTISKSSGDALVTLDYDPMNNWKIGTGSTSNVTQYTFRGVLPTTLKASTTYSYRVGDAATGAWSAIYTFTTRPATIGDNFSFLFLNDTQFSEGDDVGPVDFKKLLNAAVSTCQGDFSSLPQLVLHGGDFISENSHTYNYGNIFGSNADFFGRYPMFGTLGNHDAEKKYFFDNWNVQNPTGKGYYSFDYGPMHVVVLDNSSEGLKRLTDDQVTFLKNDMGASDAEWKFVMLHRPIYGAATYNQNGSSTDPAKPYWEYGKPSLRYRVTNVCNDVGVDFVFQAHCHQYMRSYPITEYTKTGLADDAAIKDWDDTNDKDYVKMDSSPTMSMENGANYYVNPKGTIYGTFSTAGTDPDDVFAGSSSHKDGYEENKWVMYAANGEKYSFTAVNINDGYLTIDHCYLNGSSVTHYENTKGYGIKKTA